MQTQNNKKYFWRHIALGLLALVLLVTPILLAGCEISSATERVKISPDAAVLKKGQSVTLTASGGYVYDWSLSDNTLGILNTRRGVQVLYTSLYNPPTDTPVIQIVKVTSFFSENDGTNTSGTNAPVAHEAEAYITHITVSNTP